MMIIRSPPSSRQNFAAKDHELIVSGEYAVIRHPRNTCLMLVPLADHRGWVKGLGVGVLSLLTSIVRFRVVPDYDDGPGAFKFNLPELVVCIIMGGLEGNFEIV